MSIASGMINRENQTAAEIIDEMMAEAVERFERFKSVGAVLGTAY